MLLIIGLGKFPAGCALQGIHSQHIGVAVIFRRNFLGLILQTELLRVRQQSCFINNQSIVGRLRCLCRSCCCFRFRGYRFFHFWSCDFRLCVSCSFRCIGAILRLCPFLRLRRIALPCHEKRDIGGKDIHRVGAGLTGGFITEPLALQNQIQRGIEVFRIVRIQYLLPLSPGIDAVVHKIDGSALIRCIDHQQNAILLGSGAIAVLVIKQCGIVRNAIVLQIVHDIHMEPQCKLIR